MVSCAEAWAATTLAMNRFNQSRKCSHRLPAASAVQASPQLRVLLLCDSQYSVNPPSKFTSLYLETSKPLVPYQRSFFVQWTRVITKTHNTLMCKEVLAASKDTDGTSISPLHKRFRDRCGKGRRKTARGRDSRALEKTVSSGHGWKIGFLTSLTQEQSSQYSSLEQEGAPKLHP